MSKRFTAQEMCAYLIIASQANPDDYEDYATKAAIYKAKDHVIDHGYGNLFCPPLRIGR